MTVEQVTPYILALAGIVTAIIGLRKATTEGDIAAVKHWGTLVNSLKGQIEKLEANEKESRKESAEDRQRIRALEKAEAEAARQVADSQQRIRELQTANEESKERLLLLEKDHTRLADMFKRYQRGVSILINQLKELKVEPAWSPDKEGDLDVRDNP